MITGARHWHELDAFYSQANNPTEAFLKATMHERRTWLESCGPTSAVNCLAAMGAAVGIRCPGMYSPQPEEVLMDFFNDPRNKVALNAIRVVGEDIPGNRVPQYYPYAVNEVFGRDAVFRWGLDFHEVSAYVMAGRAVQICLKNPGHYIAVVAYDGLEKELIYNDSWGKRFADGKGGWHRRMGATEFSTNVKPFFIVYT